MESNEIEFHKIWIAQCEATKDIHYSFGLQRALDYLIGEKLFNFVAAAEHSPEFASELPNFVSAIRRMFTAREICSYLDELERTKFLSASEPEDDFDLDEEDSEEVIPCNPILGAQELLRFARVKEMLWDGV